MKKENLWLTITEAASKLNSSPEKILHLGTISELELSFDWAVCKVEADTLYPSLKSIFEFVSIEDSSYCPDRKAIWESLIPSLEPDHKSDPLLRLATLSVDQIALINKYGEVSMTKAMLSTHERLDINLPKDVETMEYPKVSKKDVVVKLSDIIEYENAISLNVSKNKLKAESPRELENQSTLIGLLSKALVKKSGNSLQHMGEPNVKAIADHLELLIPEGMNTSGISNESNRKKISAGLKKLDPNNY